MVGQYWLFSVIVIVFLPNTNQLKFLPSPQELLSCLKSLGHFKFIYLGGGEDVTSLSIFVTLCCHCLFVVIVCCMLTLKTKHVPS